MAIETTCTGCGRTLRVADEHAGKQARCPICNATYTVPQPSSTSTTTASEPVAPQVSQWELRRDTQIYGPVTRQELDRWLSEGRIDANCFLRELPGSDWVPAGKVYPVLLGIPQNASPLAQQNPFVDFGADKPGEQVGQAGSAGFNSVFTPTPTYANPHRGILILMLGLFGWLLTPCPILGVIAFIMGINDTRAMDAGQMDPQGRGLTTAGMILGMLQVLIACGCLPFPLMFFFNIFR